MAGPMGTPGNRGRGRPAPPKPKNTKGTIKRLLKYILMQKGLFIGMLFFAAMCIVAIVAARVVFPKEVKEELKEEIQELKEHGLHIEEKKDEEN